MPKHSQKFYYTTIFGQKENIDYPVSKIILPENILQMFVLEMEWDQILCSSVQAWLNQSMVKAKIHTTQCSRE